MSTETKSALATAFAVLAVIAALASATVSGITAINFSNQIQDQRTENVISFCHIQNKRNAAAVRFLNGLPTGRSKASPKERARLIRGFANALVGPVHPDCAAYAYSVVRP